MNLTYVGSNPWRQNGSLPRVFLSQLRAVTLRWSSFYATRTPPAYAADHGALPGVKRYLVLLLLSAKKSIFPFCMPNMCCGRNYQTPAELLNIIQIFCDAYRPCWTSGISGWFKVCYGALDGAGAASMTDPSIPPNINSGILQPWCNAFTIVPAPLPVSEPRTDRRRDSHL